MTKDVTGFESFAQDAYPRMLRAAWLMCGDLGRAEDFVQDALIGAYRHWDRLDADPTSYVYRSIANARTTWWRKTGRHETATPPDRSRPDPRDHLTDIDLQTVVATALATLPHRQRAVLVLRFFCDLDVAATATALGCSDGTVKSQTSKALTSLRRNPVFAGASLPEGAT